MTPDLILLWWCELYIYTGLCVSFFRKTDVVHDNCFFSFYLYIKKGNLLVFLHLHCELDGWVLGVQVTQELFQGLSTMWPGGKDIIYVYI